MTCRLTDTEVIVVSSEDSGKTFVYVFFLFDSQECPSGRVFTRGSTIVFSPAFTPISGSGLKPTILFGFMQLQKVTNVLFVQLEDVEGFFL